MNNRYSQHRNTDDSDLFMYMDDDFDDSDFDDDLWEDDGTAAAGSDDHRSQSGYAAPRSRNYYSDSNDSYDDDFWEDYDPQPKQARPGFYPEHSSPANESDRSSYSSSARSMSGSPKPSGSGRHLLPVPALILLDCALIGCSLLVFALFHHVIPRSEAPVGNYVSNISSSDFSDMFTPPPVVSDTSVSAGDAEEDNLPFTKEVIVTDTSYHSPNVAVTVTTYTEEKLIYHVQDIYVRSPEYFRTALAKDTYGIWVIEETPVIAKNNNAICAVNGDYYGATKTKGIVIRNGVFYRGNGNDTDDILVLLADGSMEVYTMKNYNEEELLKKNIWHAWSFGPSLLDENGVAIEHFDSEIAPVNPRTVVGYYEPGHYCFISVEGRSKKSNGLTLSDLAAMCQSMGCKIAYNLDGGKTSVMTFGDRLVNDPYNGGRECSDILYICDSPAE